MNRIVLFEPSIATLNLGDHIIVESIKRELDFLLRDAFVVEQSTQTPIMHCYQWMDGRQKHAAQADYKFVCGSNLFWDNMLHPIPQWNINLFNCQSAADSILVGVGSSTRMTSVNRYTQQLYKKVLSKNYIHSARDEATKQHIESLGFKAMNTGCATMWSLNQEHCAKIPTQKADRVVFTLTDYLKDPGKDKELIQILERNYSELYFWPQGYGDWEYLQEIKGAANIRVLAPNLESMRSLLWEGSIDFVGTRLHGGIFAMQNYVRTIILVIDNRAGDMKNSYNIPAVDRADTMALESLIRSEWNTCVNIDENRIHSWKEQFR